MVDLDNFPNSEAAKDMLSYVTRGWYDRSYIGKWLFEVMGMEIDSATEYINSLPEQVFPETATWGISYHEIKYGLPVRNDLPLEARRKLVCEKRDTRAPMTPWKMERYLESITGCKVSVTDVNEPGNKIVHPNVFDVSMQGDGEIDLGTALKKLRTVKQSHTSFRLKIITKVHIELCPGMERFRVSYIECGTYPNRAIERRETFTEVQVASVAKGHKRRIPLAGNSGEAGRYPNTNRGLGVTGSEIEAVAYAQGHFVSYPDTSEDFNTGSYPGTSAGAAYAESGVETAAKTDGFKYQNAVSGTVPGVAAGLAEEKALAEIETSGMGFEVAYTITGENETGTVPVPSSGLGESGQTLVPGVKTEKYQVRYKLCGNTLEI